MNNEVMGGVVISLVSERPDKLLRRSGNSASSLSEQSVTLRGNLRLSFSLFFSRGTAGPRPSHFLPSKNLHAARQERWEMERTN